VISTSLPSIRKSRAAFDSVNLKRSSASARPVAGPSFLVGHRHDDDFAGVEAVVNGEREAAEDAFMRMRATRPASRRLGDFFDGGTDDPQKIIAATGALLVVTVGTTVEFDLCGAEESDTGLDWHAWASLSLTQALGDLGLHIAPFDDLGTTFVEFLRSSGQFVIPGLVDRRLIVTFLEAAPQIICDLLTLAWFELKRSIEDLLRAQHVFSLPRAGWRPVPIYDRRKGAQIQMVGRSASGCEKHGKV